MSRLLSCLLTLAILTQPMRAAETTPAPLPETRSHGDSPPSYPAECARRIEAGKRLLDSGDLKGAWREFDLAERAESAEPMSYFYRAVIAYRQGDYPVALKMADVGRDIANENVYRADKPVDADLTATALRLTELYDTIKAKADANPGQGNAVALLRSADEAYANGLLAKAASAYAEAFRADPTQGEVGLKAATLFADRLKNPLEAARLWQQVLAAGEPHATVARAELQSRRDVLDAVLREGLAKRDQWHNRGVDVTEPLSLAEAFPESTDLQVELAVLFFRKGSVESMVKHLQSASRLGLSADDFLARRDIVDFLQQTGGLEKTGVGKALATFVRDAYGEEALTTIRTELKRRSDEIARLAREKTEKERLARLAKELRELNTWRHTERMKAVHEVNALLSSRNGIEVPTARVTPDKHDRSRSSRTRANSFAYENGQYVLRSDNTIAIYYANGRITTSGETETSTFTSVGTFAGLTARPSNWLDVTTETAFQPAAGFRQLCQLLSFTFSSGVISRRVVWRDYNGAATSHLDTANQPHILLQAMVTEPEILRFRQLFLRLAQLDQAGDNLVKLRQLR